MRRWRLITLVVLPLAVCGGGGSALAASGKRSTHRTHRGTGQPVTTRIVPFVKRLSIRSGSTSVLLPGGARAAYVQAELAGPGTATFGAPGGASVSVGGGGAGGGLAATQGRHLAVHVSGHPRQLLAYVVALLVTGSRGDTLHQAIGDTASTLPSVTLSRGKTASLKLPADAAPGARDVLATLTGPLAKGAVLSAGSVPVMAGARSASALLPVQGGRLRLHQLGRGRSIVRVQVLAYVAPNRASSAGASPLLFSHPQRSRTLHGELTLRVAGSSGLSGANTDAPTTGGLVSIRISPGPGQASVSPVPLTTDDGRTLSAAEAIPYASAGRGQASSTTVWAPLSSAGQLLLHGNSSRIHVQLLGAAAGDLRIRPDTLTLQPDELDRITSVTANSVSFQGVPAGLSKVKSGYVIASAMTPQTPQGLLRKVTAVSVSGGNLTLSTIPATLRDVLLQGSIKVQSNPTASQLRSFEPLARGVRLAPHDNSGPIGVNFDVDLQDWGPGNYVDVTGPGVQISPSLNFTANASLFPPSFSAQFTASAQESLNAAAEAYLGANNVEYSARLARAFFAPIPEWVGIPFTVVPETEIDLNLSGGAHALLDASISQSRTFTYGVGFSTSNGFYTIANVSPNSFTHSVHLNGDTNLMLSATLGLNFFIDYLVGPGVSVGPYVQWQADTTANPWWKLNLGIAASAQFSINVLGLSYSHTFATLGGTVADAGGPFETLAIAAPKTITLARGATHQFYAETQGVNMVDWSTDGGTVSSSGLYTAPMTAGTYQVTAASADEPAANDTATVTVPPDPPSAPTGVSGTPAPGGATVTWQPPSDDGGTAISSYTVTASPGGAQMQVPGNVPRQVTFTGLTAKKSYTFTVTATNPAGSGPASAPSAPVQAGNGAYAAVEPDALQFPNTKTGSTSPPQTVTLLAAASQSLTVDSITFTGTPPNQFTIENDNCSGQTIPANGSCTFQVAFAPTASNGDASDTVQITDSDPASPQDVSLSYSYSFPAALESVSMPGASDIFGVGDATINDNSGSQAGTAVTSSDGGATWQVLDLSSTTDPNDPTEEVSGGSFSSAEDGCIVGSYHETYRVTGQFILCTTDGGQSWSQGSLPSDVESLNGIHMLNASDGFATGQSNGGTGTLQAVLLTTTDGGQTWNEVTAAPSGLSGDSYQSVDFASDNLHGVITGTGYDSTSSSEEDFALYTSDGGQTWKLSDIGDGSYVPSFLSPTAGSATDWWAVGPTQLYASTDGGATWSAESSPSLTNATSVAFADALDGWVVDDPGVTDVAHGNPPSAEHIWHTTDGGQTWTEAGVTATNQNCATPPGGSGYFTNPVLTQIAAADASDVVIGGQEYVETSDGNFAGSVAGIEVSHDGGQTWTATPCW
ncbi:MAG TPA: choice-of-anchor D domain-containing protein [Solirubrobacteraceae bacterium]|nr:choice-of-anchor D domain-containing protein [Solirubrobacteraceae bacterium]